MDSNFIPYSYHHIDSNDIEKVISVLRTSYITQGPQVEEFENLLTQMTRCKYALAVNNGTAALHLAMLAIGIGPGDEVISTPNTFVASTNASLYCGAKVSFVDIDKDNLCLSAEALEAELLKRSSRNETMPKAIVNVLFAGNTSNAKAIYDIASRYDILVVEDSCHALGGHYEIDNLPVGSGKYSDLSILSFHPAKHITTGEGGAILTNHERFASKIRSLRSHGQSRSNFEYIQEDESPLWYYEIKDLGYNYRITDIQCSLGISQLSKLNNSIKSRNKTADFYSEKLKKCPFIKTPMHCNGHAWHLYVLEIDFQKLGVGRGDFMAYLKTNNIGTQVHYIPVYRHPLYRKKFGYSFDLFPNTEKYYSKCVSIPMYYGLNDDNLQKVTNTITNFIKRQEGKICV